MCTSPPARKILDTEHLVRHCPNERVIYDDNIKMHRFMEEEFGFFFDKDTDENLGLSTDNLEWIHQDYPSLCRVGALQQHIRDIFTVTFLAKKSWAIVNAGQIRALSLNIAHTPTKTKKPADRPHHCDVLPTQGENDYIDDQQRQLYLTHEIILNHSSESEE